MDLRDMLVEAGVGQFNAAMSIQYMNFLPRTSDPYAQGIMQIVEGIQRLLNRNGAGLVVDGGMGIETIRGVMKYSGPRWYDKSWAQIYGDIMEGERWGGVDREDRGLADYGSQYQFDELGSTFVDDVIASPFPWIIGGFLLYKLANKKGWMK